MKYLNNFSEEELQTKNHFASINDKNFSTEYDSQSVVDAMKNNKEVLNEILNDLYQKITSH